MKGMTGKIISLKTPKSAVVVVEFSYRHPKYHKIIRRTTKLLAQCDVSGVTEGDEVTVVASRPYSKRKHFRVVGKV